MKLTQWTRNKLEIKLTTASFQDTLNELCEKQISLFHVNINDDLTLCFWINQKDFPCVEEIANNRGDTLEVKQKRGIFPFLSNAFRRPVLLLGLLLFLSFSMYIPSRIYFIQVEGNTKVSSNEILEAASKCGIYWGASRRTVRSEKIKNALLNSLPELQWAGINTSGCTATISVREKETEASSEEQYPVSSIVASRDGIITSIVATKGTPVSNVGQAVRSGDVLISGYTDCGLFLQASQAQGEVFAKTHRSSSVYVPNIRYEKGNEKVSNRCLSIILGKKRINLWKGSGIQPATCGRIYKEYFITLPGSFTLPFGIALDTYTSYELVETSLDLQDLSDRVSQWFEGHLTNSMLAGRIERKKENFHKSDGCYQLIGSYDCVEMISQVRQETIGE